MTEKKFLSKNDIEILTEDIIKVIEAHLIENFVLEDKKNNMFVRMICPKCNKNKGRLRKGTNDYKCENCKEVFKK